MKKKLTALFLVLALTLAFVPSAHAASAEAQEAADALHALGLFQGTGTNPDGTLIYDLDRTPSREQAVTMMIRLLGKEAEALAGTWVNSFTDVSDWAKPYIGYAYANKLVNGLNDEGTLFGGGDNTLVSATQYITLVLRSLGFESGKDFQWDAAWEFSDKLGITDGRYNAATDSSFTRGDIAIISLAAYRYGAGLTDGELERAVALGLTTQTTGSSITYRQYFQILDNLVGLLAPENLAGYKTRYPAARGSDEAMTRYGGMVALLTAAEALGGDYADLNDWDTWDALRLKMGDDAWNDVHWPGHLFGPGTEDPINQHGWTREATSFLWSFGRKSLLTDQTLFDYDAVANSMRPAQGLTWAEAVKAVVRLHDSVWHTVYAPADDPAAVTPDPAALPANLVAQAAASAVTDLDQLPRLTGFVLSTGAGYGTTQITTRPADINMVADWGFSSSRIMLTYETLFNADATQVNLTELEKLDLLVAAAVRNGLHLNLLLCTLPGRTTWYGEGFTSGGDFDLFINPAKQKTAATVWSLLAQRYKDIPGEYLSFTPFWEATNFDLSTGVGGPDYTPADVTRVLDQLIAAIRSADPDRFIFYEMTANNTAQDAIWESTEAYKAISAKYDNTRISFNFCDMPYVYAEMTATSGEHIDFNNHSMFKPDYPVTIYAANGHVTADSPVAIGGFLPAGTQLEIYLGKAGGNGSFTVSDAAGTLYTETLTGDVTWKTGTLLSGFYPFAESDKKITLTLGENSGTVKLATTGSAWADWCGINVILPQEYAVERWYMRSEYDAYKEGGEEAGFYFKKTSTVMICPNSYGDKGNDIVINRDVTYSSEAVWAASSKETVDAWGKAISEFAPSVLVRFERGGFNLGTTRESLLAYYEDVLAMLDARGFDWYSNDYDNILYVHGLADPHTQQYGNYDRFNMELLQLLQKHQ